jgi:hypothetical protein
MSRWWRAYDEAVDDPKLILLSDKAHRAWFNLMCIASANDGVLPDIKIVAVKLRVSPQRAAAAITELVKAELLDERDDGSFEPHNWRNRQFTSDRDPTATDRKRRERDKKRGHDDVTRDITDQSRSPETETETETETEKIPSLRSGGAETPSKAKRARARSSLPDGWTLDEQDIGYAADRGFDVPAIERMSSGFANHHRSRGNLMADWHAAWRTWTDNEIKFSNLRTQGQAHGRRTVHDAANDLLAKLKAIDEPAPGGLCGGTGEAPLRLISPR